MFFVCFNIQTLLWLWISFHFLDLDACFVYIYLHVNIGILKYRCIVENKNIVYSNIVVPPLVRMSLLHWNSGLIRGTTFLKGNTLVVFHYLSTCEIWSEEWSLVGETCCPPQGIRFPDTYWRQGSSVSLDFFLPIVVGRWLKNWWNISSRDIPVA
jgi:hypothetical protein